MSDIQSQKEVMIKVNERWLNKKKQKPVSMNHPWRACLSKFKRKT